MALRINNLVKDLVEQEKKLSRLDFLIQNYVVQPDKKAKSDPFDTGEKNLIPIIKKTEIPPTEAGGKGKIKIEKKLSPDALFNIIKGDPTSIIKENGKGLKDVEKVGQYVQWLMKVYFALVPNDYIGKKDSRYTDISEQARLFFEDLEKTKEDLTKYNRFNKRLPENKRDIMKDINSTDELYNMVNKNKADVVDATSATHIKRKRRADLEYVYEDPKWEVVIPKNVKASYEVAGPPLTRWCTAASATSSHHDSYSKSGPLYIIRDPNQIIAKGKAEGEPKPIYQFHFHSGQYMDAEDRQIDLIQFLSKNPGLKGFFKPQFEGAWNKKDFNPEDKTFQNYVSLYGAGKEIMQQVENILKTRLEANDEINARDDAREFQGFIGIFGHDQFVDLVFKYAKSSLTTLEIAFTKYIDKATGGAGKGVNIPESLGRFTNITNLVLSGFVKTIPHTIGNCRSLELIAISKNPLLTSLPEEIGTLPNLEVINVTDTKLGDRIPKSVTERSDREILVVNQ